jgi:hypothetical protein
MAPVTADCPRPEAVKRHADVTEIRQNLALGSVTSAIGVERVE